MVEFAKHRGLAIGQVYIYANVKTIRLQRRIV